LLVKSFSTRVTVWCRKNRGIVGANFYYTADTEKSG